VSPDDPLLDRRVITEAFRRLGDRLARRDLVADIYVFGGAAMALGRAGLILEMRSEITEPLRASASSCFGWRDHISACSPDRLHSRLWSGVAVIARSCMLSNAVPPTRRTHPSRTSFRRLAPLAQSAERLHGKEKVYGSIP
jgi:hypothetical protein